MNDSRNVAMRICEDFQLTPCEVTIYQKNFVYFSQSNRGIYYCHEELWRASVIEK